MIVGRVREIWRYPVKSMAGEKLMSCTVGSMGIPGDRGWALRDDVAGEIRGAKNLPKLLQYTSSYREQPIAGQIPHVDISLPDGTCIGSDDPEINACLSALLGRTVSLWPLQPASDKAHYRRAQVGAALIGKLSRSPLLRPLLEKLLPYTRFETMTRELLSREPGEPLLDYSSIPSELFEFTSPPGTYFDLAPIHLLTTSSLAAMQRLNPSAAWDAPRFRPNFLIETRSDIDGLVEAGLEWTHPAAGRVVLDLRDPHGALRNDSSGPTPSAKRLDDTTFHRARCGAESWHIRQRRTVQPCWCRGRGGVGLRPPQVSIPCHCR